MRRMVFLGLASAVALSVVALTRGAGGVPPADVAPTSVPAPWSQPSQSPEPVAHGAPLRNVFEYGLMPDARPDPPAQPRLVQPPGGGIPDPAAPVRFVGVVARGGRVSAALVIEGEVVLLSPGESAAGYTLLGVDPEEGVRLRTPAGAEMGVSANP